VVNALVSIGGPSDGPDPLTMREAVPPLVVGDECGCGCPSFFMRDSRQAESEGGSFHYSNAVTPDGRIGLALFVKDDDPGASM